MKHRLSEILIAIADGKEIEYNSFGDTWTTISSTSVFQLIGTIEAKHLRVKLETNSHKSELYLLDETENKLINYLANLGVTNILIYINVLLLIYALCALI